MGYKNPNAMVCFDKLKFITALKKRGLSMTDASVKIGFSPSYFGNCVSRRAMPITTVLLVEHILDISREEFQVVKEKPVVEQTEETENTECLDYNRLYQVIYSATYHAYRQAIIDRKAGKF